MEPQNHIPDGHIDTWDHLALDLLDGTLPESQSQVLRAHLDGCAACGAAFDEQRAMAGLLRAVPLAPVPEDLEDAVLGAVLSRATVATPAAPPAARPGAGRPSEPAAVGMIARLRHLLRPRVWLPAAAFALILGVAVTSYYGGALQRDEGILSAGTDDTMQAAAPATESDASRAGEGASPETLKEGTSEADATATTAASATTTTAGNLTAAGYSAPTAQIAALGDSVGDDPPVVWATVAIPPAERDNAFLLMTTLTDLAPLSSAAADDQTPDALPVYAALISSSEVDAFTAALGISALQVMPLAESMGVLPPEASVRLSEGPGLLPRLEPPSAGDGTAAYGWWTSPPDPAKALAGQVVVVVSLVAATD